MPIEAVNNNKQKTYVLPGTLIGLTTGAVAGGTYGYLSKPWLKNGNITDQFIKKADVGITDAYIDISKQIGEDLKSILKTGSMDEVSEAYNLAFADEGLKEMTPEGRKAYIQNLLQREGYDSVDAYCNSICKVADSESVNVRIRLANDIKSLQADKTSVDDLKKILAKLNLDSDLIMVTEESKKDVLEFLNTMSNAQVEGAMRDRRNIILKYVDVSKKSMKKLPSNADLETKSMHSAVKETINSMNLKTAAKFGGIVAGALGTIGLIVGLMNNKKS